MGARQTGKAVWGATFTVPFRTKPLTNEHFGHWTRRHRAVKAERHAFAWAWVAAGKPKPPGYPATVTFTRISAGTIDDDNLLSCFKGMRDELASRLGLRSDAGDEIRWRYRQERAPRGTFGVRVEMTCEYWRRD